MSHASRTTPTYTLMVRYPDDTMSVVCHWHKEPTHSEIADGLAFYVKDIRLNDWIGYIVAKTSFSQRRRDWEKSNA